MYNIYGRINLSLLSLCSPWTTVMATPWSVGSPCLLWIHFFPLAFLPINLSENSILSSHLLLREICSQSWVQGKQEPIIISAINDLSDWLKGLTLRTNQNSSPNLKQNLLVTVVFRKSEEASSPETIFSGKQLFQLERARSRDEEKGEWEKSRDSMVGHVDM